MNLVVDANVVKGYFEVLFSDSESSDLTADPSQLFDRASQLLDVIFVDNDGHIKHEWSNVVEPDWFERWFKRMLLFDAIQLIPTTSYHLTLNAVEKLGFPRSRDRWYIRVAKSTQEQFGSAVIVTEDVDFYDPARKNESANRLRILRSGSGKVSKHLRRKEKIDVVCVENYLKLIEE